MTVTLTEGRWDLAEAPIFFPAMGHARKRAADICDSVLFNILDIHDVSYIESVAARGCRILLDSGIFTLATAEAKRRGVALDVALGLQPEEVNGWDSFVDKWKATISSLRDHLWGYIELDLGGAQTKTRTRESLERDGFRPIPVHHPLADGWDYFEFLCDRYDRVCVAHFTSVKGPGKLEILRQVSERRKGRAVKWIHALGVSPAPSWITIPTESCDSSAPAAPLRFPSPMLESTAMVQKFLPSMPFRYNCGPERYLTMCQHLSRNADLVGAFCHAHLRAQK